jgi:hypothetical protein
VLCQRLFENGFKKLEDHNREERFLILLPTA